MSWNDTDRPYPTGESGSHWNDPRHEQPFVSGRGEPAVTGERLTGDERTAAILAHLSAPLAMILTAGSLSLVGPLIVWLIYRNRSQVVRQAAAGAFNFNLSWWILYWVGWLFFFTFIGIPPALVLWGVIVVVAAVCHIRGAMRAGDGRPYRYPFQIPVLS